jgi:outer membrane protein TolC
MLILAKEVDALQSQVIETYYQYRHTQERWKLSQEAIRVLDQARGPDGASVAPELQALLPVMDSLHQSAQQDEASCKQAFVNARNALGLLVGGEALVALEQVHAKQASSH